MSKKIVLAEDEPQIARLVEFKLKKEGYSVTTKENGEEALKAIKEDKPDLVLLDIMMPVMGGYEVLRRLKEDENLKSIPVIMLTAKSTVGDMDHAFNRRADGYITKPFDGETLGATIRKNLKEMKKSYAVSK